jgi:protein-disulfide isomerase
VNDENSLFVPASLPADTVVGHVTPGSTIGNSRLFEINNPSQPSDLALLPDDHLEGDPAAPVVLIEYLDLACPVCKTFAPFVTSLKQQFPDDLLVVSRHLPLNSGTPGDTSFHPYGWEAAQAAEAAAKQGKFPEMIALLFDCFCQRASHLRRLRDAVELEHDTVPG